MLKIKLHLHCIAFTISNKPFASIIFGNSVDINLMWDLIHLQKCVSFGIVPTYHKLFFFSLTLILSMYSTNQRNNDKTKNPKKKNKNLVFGNKVDHVAIHVYNVNFSSWLLFYSQYGNENELVTNINNIHTHIYS